MLYTSCLLFLLESDIVAGCYLTLLLNLSCSVSVQVLRHSLKTDYILKLNSAGTTSAPSLNPCGPEASLETVSGHGGRTCLSASRVFWPSLSGNLTVKSRIMSPLFSGHLDRGSPSPTIRFFIPGLTTSLEVTVMVRPSSVGALTVHPHSACREDGKQGNVWLKFDHQHL